MKALLFATYDFLKALVRFGLWLFYRKVTILNREKMPSSGPLIVVTNHPNTIVDPFLAAAQFKQPVYFLANAGLFKSKIGNWFFSTFFCIPIQRSVDSGGKPIDNKIAFAKCISFLENGGSLFIAAEGGSFVGRNLKRLKTGTARIALSTEEANDFNLDLKILPIGLVYERAAKFRSDVIVNVGDPISLKSYQESYREESFKTAKKLTRDLQNQLSDLLINPADENQSEEVQATITMVKNTFTLSPKEFVKFFQYLLQPKNLFPNGPTSWFNAHGSLAYQYAQKRKNLYISDQAVLKSIHSNQPNWFHWLILMIGAPLFLYGAINHIFIVGIPIFLWKRLGLYPTYEGTVYFLGSLFLLILFYPLQLILIWIWLGWPTALIYGLTLIPSGFFAKWYLDQVNLLLHNRRLKHLSKLDPHDFQYLTNTRTQLQKALKEAHQIFSGL